MFYTFQNIGLSLLWLTLFVPRYFILFDVILNEFLFLNLSLSDSSSLVYGKATDFYILVLYPATLVNSFISSQGFCGESFGFSI